jgi:hypothetical protein
MRTIKRIRKNNQTFVLRKDAGPSCECCCPVKSALQRGDLRAPTAEEALRSIGKTCGRCGDNPFPELITVWPTLPCVGPNIIVPTLYGADAFTTPDGVFPRWRRDPACIRFQYRIVNYEGSANGSVIDQGELNSGTRSLLSAIEEAYPYRSQKSNLFVGESCGLYIYAIEFYAWRSNCTRWTGVIGGAQPQGENRPECSPIAEYGQDMFSVRRAGPFLKWPPYFDENCEELIGPS